MVEKHQKAIEATGFLKMAQDLAGLLDSPEFNCEIEKMNFLTKDLARSRENIFDRFCAICVKAGIKIPEYEPLFYMAFLDGIYREGFESEKSMEKKILAYVEGQLTDKESSVETQKIKSLIEILKIFPSPGYGRIDDEKIYAMLNFLLVQMGCEPFRPDYSQYPLRNIPVLELEREFKVLIVDDDKQDILQTARVLAGWPKMIIDFYFHKSEHQELKSSEKAKKLSEVAHTIIMKSPDIIFMDQSMGDVEGDELIRAIKVIQKGKIIFVANTGGSDAKLQAEGTLENFRKGNDFRGLNKAIEIIKSRMVH